MWVSSPCGILSPEHPLHTAEGQEQGVGHTQMLSGEKQREPLASLWLKCDVGQYH